MAIQHVDWKQPGLNHDPDADSLESMVKDPGERVTLQSTPGIETDVNVIARNYGLTGEMPVRRTLGEYGTFDDSLDFRAMIETVRHGEEVFASLPADLRGRFNNEPGGFMDWIHDPANYAEAVKLGILEQGAAPQVTETVASQPSPELLNKELQATKEPV